MSTAEHHSIPEHPMDEFPVRALQFSIDDLQDGSTLWSRSCPDFSMMISALGLHVPYFERYLVKAMSAAKQEIDDPALLRDVRAIIGQEAHHAKNFIRYNARMAERYPKVAKLVDAAREDFAMRAKSDDLKTLVGFTAGYETFTFIAGLLILDNYDQWLADSDPVMKAVWVWHQVEEVEHGAVAFDVYRHLYGEDEWFRKRMVLKAAIHIASETAKAHTHFAAVEYGWRRPLRFLRSMGFLGRNLTRFLIQALPVFRRGYHPKRHPLVNKQQNPVQVAWRRYEKGGGDVLEIDHDKMAEIMELRPAA